MIISTVHIVIYIEAHIMLKLEEFLIENFPFIIVLFGVSWVALVVYGLLMQ